GGVGTSAAGGAVALQALTHKGVLQVGDFSATDSTFVNNSAVAGMGGHDGAFGFHNKGGNSGFALGGAAAYYIPANGASLGHTITLDTTTSSANLVQTKAGGHGFTGGFADQVGGGGLAVYDLAQAMTINVTASAFNANSVVGAHGGTGLTTNGV